MKVEQKEALRGPLFLIMKSSLLASSMEELENAGMDKIFMEKFIPHGTEVEQVPLV